MEAREMLEAVGRGSAQDASYVNDCIKKWQPLLESTNPADPVNYNPYVKGCTAVVMENQAKHLVEDTTTGGAAYFTKYVFPVLRRVWPNLITNQIVSVQPMNAPVGGVFYFEKKFSNTKGTKVPPGGISNDPTDMAYDGKLSAGDNMTQNLGKYYSSEFVDYDAVCTDTGTGTSGALTQGSANSAAAAWKPIRANGTVGQRTFYVKAYYRMLDADAASADTEVIATMDASGNLIDNTANTNTVGTFDIATGNWSINAAGSGGTNSPFTNNTVIYLQYFVEWEQVGFTTGAAIPSVELKVTLQEIRAESRKLKAKWTVEAVEDMKALHGINAEQEIVNTFSQDTLMEIDREIIGNLINGAAHSLSYTYSPTVPGEIESIRQAVTQLNALSAKIHRTSGRAPANFIVCGPDFQALLDQLSTHGDFASIESDIQSTSYGPLTANYGITRVGTLLRKWAVYVDPYQDPTKVLIGLKGNSYYDAGFVYAPYIPLSLTPTFLDPDDQTNRKGVWTRYATKMLRSEYYGVLNVSGLPNVTTVLP